MIIKIPRDKVEISKIVSIKQELDEGGSNHILCNVKETQATSNSNLTHDQDTQATSNSNLTHDQHGHIERSFDVSNIPIKELHNQIKETSDLITSSDKQQTFWCNECTAKFYYKKNLVEHITREHTRDPSDADNRNILTSQNMDILETVAVKSELGEDCFNDILCEVKYSNTTSFKFEGQISILDPRKETPNRSNKAHQNQNEVVKPNSIDSLSQSNVNRKLLSNVCTAEFQFKKKLAQHLSEEHENKKSNTDQGSSNLSASESFKCLFCSKSYKLYSKMLRHIRKYHPSFSCYRCLFCRSWFSSVTNLATHSQSVHSQSTHACETCWNVYTSPEYLETHFKVCQSSSSRKVQINCKICNKTFYSKHSFELHVRVHMGVRYPCIECRETFLHYKTMIRHKKLKHDGNALKCKLCLKVFSDKSDLNRHMSSVHIGKYKLNDNKPFYCDLCGSKFSRKDHMRDHIRMVHMKEGFRCSHCSRSFATNSSLKRHRMKLSEEKNTLTKVKYCCDLCRKKYSEKRQLRDHLNKHYGV